MSPSISFQFERSSLCYTGFCIYNHQSSMFTSADFLNSNRNGSVAFLMYQAALFSSALTQLSQAICPLLPFSLIPTICQCYSWDEKPHTSLITSLFSDLNFAVHPLSKRSLQHLIITEMQPRCLSLPTFRSFSFELRTNLTIRRYSFVNLVYFLCITLSISKMSRYLYPSSSICFMTSPGGSTISSLHLTLPLFKTNTPHFFKPISIKMSTLKTTCD